MGNSTNYVGGTFAWWNLKFGVNSVNVVKILEKNKSEASTPQAMDSWFKHYSRCKTHPTSNVVGCRMWRQC